MNKSELAAISAERAGITKKDAQRLLDVAFETISQELAKGEKVTVTGFGIFEVKTRAPRMGRDPVTGEGIPIPAIKMPTFRPSQSLKDKVGEDNET